MSPEGSQTLERGLRLLETLASEEGENGLSVSQLATRMSVSRPALYRLLATLEGHGLVVRDSGGRCRLGPGLLALARSVTPGLRQAALPGLRRLAEATGATAHLTVADLASDEAVAVAVVEPSRTDFHVAYRVGSRHRLDRGAAGRAILAARRGDRAPFVVTEGELQPGALGIAAPLLGVAGLEASVGLVALGPVLDPARVGPMVVAAAAALARTLTQVAARTRVAAEA